MKKNTIKVGWVLFVFIVSNYSTLGMVLSATPPPPPPPPPVDMPINDHLIPILLISLLFGGYMIYRYNRKQKNPV